MYEIVDAHDLPLPPADPPHRARGKALLGGLLVVAVAGSAAGAVSLLQDEHVAIEMALPADVELAVISSLEPPPDQALNLLTLSSRFPHAGSDDLGRRVRDALDDGLAGMSLSFDDLSWAGPDVALSVQLDAPGSPAASGASHEALVVATTDAAAANETLRKAREAQTSEDWSLAHHRGVDLWVGPDSAYAVDRGFAIVGSGRPAVAEILDVLAGDRPALGEAQTFVDAMAPLPDERLGSAFVNVRSFLQDLARQPGAPKSLPSRLGDLEAVAGVGMSLRAEPDGLAFDAVVTYDPGKVSDELRDRLQRTGGPGPLVGSLPDDAFAVAVQAGYAADLAAGLERLAADMPEVAAELERLGVTGPGGLLGTLSGDAGFEIGPGDPVAGSIVLATDDEVGLRRALDRLFTDAAGMTRSKLRFIDGNPSITVLEIDGSFHVAYTVADGQAVIATSVGRLRQVLAATSGRGSILDDPAYAAAVDRVDAGPSILYVDVPAIVAAVREALPPQERDAFDERVAPDLASIEAVVASGSAEGLTQRARLFILIPNKE